MPELPEVETLVRSFKPLEGSVIDGISINFKKLREPLNIEQLTSIKDISIQSCFRKAKYMLWLLSTQQVIVFHLGMSGTLRARHDRQLKKHDHLTFSINKELYAYNDPRRFGMIWVFDSEKDFYAYRTIGIEPLSKHFNAEFLFNLLKQKKTSIKSLLFNQSLIAGLGNIYINEALYLAKIRPHRPASELSLHECKNLASSIKGCLEKAIRSGGSTLSDFHDPHGKKGWFQNQHLVYNKTQCVACKNPIVREILAQRSTFYCPSCQS